MPSPKPRATIARDVNPDEEKFSGFVFKIQANMDPRHRDRIAFLRVTCGRFERGMNARHLRLQRDVRLSHPHRFFGQERISIEEAWPGDVVGMYKRSPSSSGGMNSPPIRCHEIQVRITAAAASASTVHRCRNTTPMTGR